MNHRLLIGLIGLSVLLLSTAGCSSDPCVTAPDSPTCAATRAEAQATITALQEVIRTDKNVIAVGFAMDALARLANLPSQDAKPQPLLADLQTKLRDILGEAPVQCWESLVREGVTP